MRVRRRSCTGPTASSYRSAPSSSTRRVTQPPSDSSCIRFRHRRKVLLPQPDGPITAVTVWAGKRMETSFTTARRPYRAVRRTVSSRSRASAGGAMALPDGPAGGDAEQQHQRHEHEGRGPREAVPLLERPRSEEHTSELQSQSNLVCRLLLEKKKKRTKPHTTIPPKKRHLTHR